MLKNALTLAIGGVDTAENETYSGIAAAAAENELHKVSRKWGAQNRSARGHEGTAGSRCCDYGLSLCEERGECGTSAVRRQRAAGVVLLQKLLHQKV